MAKEPTPEVAQAERLTEALRRSGALMDGRVSSVSVENSWSTVLSRITRLQLTYEHDEAQAPRTLILKTGLPERLGNETWDAGRQEVAFYTQVASTLSVPLVPRCLEAAWEAETRAWHLLLEDLTNSHVIATTWPLPPTFEQCQTIIRARARFQAQWWDNACLGVSVGSWADAEDGAMERNLQRFADQLETFSDREGDRLPRERRNLFEQLIEAGPRLNERYRSHRHMTIVQGDAHFWNCFLPKGGGGDVRLFDWDCWSVDIGSDDLAYMIAMHWYPDRRCRMERPLLDCYHASLVEHGVRGYDRRALDDDYRLSVLCQITTPIRQANAKIPPVIWWNNLERILMAVDDLGCRDLLA
jgi:hypothetical protein